MVHTGIGYDVHRLTEGRSLWLGGVEIEHSKGLEGHSDADVLIHAIMDALLGAAALGDIGKHFPNNEAKFKDIDVKKMNIDFLSISAHKIYGPKGIGALYIKSKNSISPIMYGGSQEKSIRPGTLSVPLIVGFGEASKLAKKHMNNDVDRIKSLQKLFLSKIKENLEVIINGCEINRIPGNLNLSFPQLNGQSIINSLPKISISSGSACTSSSPKPSHVLLNIGIDKKTINSSIRVGIGRFNTKEEIILAANDIINAVKNKK